jgi:CTP:molybdopterin cytidylyltransferase MocA
MPGGTKLLRSWGEGVVIEAVVATAHRSDLDPTCVVLGPDASGLKSQLAGSGVVTISHPQWNRGRFSTLGMGLSTLRRSKRSRAVVVLLGDEPGMAEEAVRAVVSAWRSTGAQLVRARYRDRPGHPVLIAREAWAVAIDSAAVQDDSRTTWERLCSLGLEAHEVAVDGPAPIDVDDPAALERARIRRNATVRSRTGVEPG